MATKLTPTGVKFKDVDIEQPRPVVSVNSIIPDDLGNIEVSAGGGATYTNQKYHATTDFLFKDSKWYGGHVVYSYSSNETEIENLSVGNVLHEVGSDLSFSVVSIDSDSNTITLNRNDFVDLDISDKTLEDRENSTFSSTTFTYVSGSGSSINCTNIWLQVKGNENHANVTSLPTTVNSVANLPMKLDHLPSVATHIIFRVSSETGGSFKIYNRESFNTRPATAELLPSEIVHQVDVEDDSGTQSGVSEFRVPVNSYFRFWVTGGAKANLYPVGYSVLDLSEIDLESVSNPVITDLETRINTLENNSGSGTVTSVNNVLPDSSGNVTIDVGSGGNVTPPQNLFLNLDIAINDEFSSKTSTYGYTKNGQPTTYYKTYTVPEFENFKINHSDKYKLSFYSQGGYREVIISDLISINPTSTNPLFLNYDDDTEIDSAHEIWFDGNDLVYKAGFGTTSSSAHGNRNYPPYRIDMHLSSSSGSGGSGTVTSVNNVQPDSSGNVTINVGNITATYAYAHDVRGTTEATVANSGYSQSGALNVARIYDLNDLSGTTTSGERIITNRYGGSGTFDPNGGDIIVNVSYSGHNEGSGGGVADQIEVAVVQDNVLGDKTKIVVWASNSDTSSNILPCYINISAVQYSSSGSGIVTNLFLDYDEVDLSSESGNNWVYGPNNNETYPTSNSPSVYLWFNVAAFENFFDNHGDKYKLSIYSGTGYTEVYIQDLKTHLKDNSKDSFYVQYDDTQGDNLLYFEFKNNDLILRAFTATSATYALMHRIYRIDVHSFATEPLDVYTKTEVDSLVSSSGDVTTYKTEGNVVDLDSWSNNWLNICSFTVPNINDIRTLGVDFEINFIGLSKLNSGNHWGNYIQTGCILRRIPPQSGETYSNISSWEWQPKSSAESNLHAGSNSLNRAGGNGMSTGIYFIVDNNTNLCTIYSAILTGVVGTNHRTRVYAGALFKILNSTGDNTISNFQWNFTEGPTSLP